MLSALFPRKLLPMVMDPYAIEGVLTYFVGAAKKKGVPMDVIVSTKEFQEPRKETKWHLLKEHGEQVYGARFHYQFPTPSSISPRAD